MSKQRRIGGGGVPGGGGFNQAAAMKQLQKMQEDMQNAQTALETETVETSVGGGMVAVTITGHQRVQAIKIDASKIDTTDDEWINDLQDLLVIAVNQAIEQSQTMAAQRMESITGGLGNIPGLGGLLGG